MSDPDKNPFRYGSSAYEKRRAYEIDRIQSGRSVTPYTIGGQSAARQAASERRARSLPSPPPADPPPFYRARSSVQPGPFADGGAAPTWTGPARTRRSSGSFGKVLAFGGGVFGAIYAGAHGAGGTTGLAVGFMLGFVGVGVVIHYLKKLFG
jgi:hypothetical protein